MSTTRVPSSLREWNDACEDAFVECVATPVHKGRTTQVWDASVNIEGADKIIARFRCIQLILRT